MNAMQRVGVAHAGTRFGDMVDNQKTPPGFNAL